MTDPAVLHIDNLSVTFATPDGPVEAVRGVSFHVRPGETLAIVGESGSGKSQVMLAALGLLAPNGRATGSARYRGTELLGLAPKALDRIRGNRVTMIFQEPMTSLDPLVPIGRQIAEPLIVHRGLSRRAARARVLALLDLVRMPEAKARLGAFPHELSGGQRQRVMIAMALANDPDLLIADEPTTALDVTIQAEILALLAELQARLGMAILFVTHDLGIVRAFAGRTCILRRGEVVETGPTARIFAAPRTGYARMLIDAEPDGRKTPVPPEAPIILTAEEISVSFDRGGGLFAPRHRIAAVRDVSLSLRRGETLGIVGESGSGKSTLARAILRLLPSDGRVVFLGRDITDASRAALRPLRKSLQVVFQDPYGALSPRLTVAGIVAEGLLVHAPDLTPADRARRAAEALREVDLDPAIAGRFPHELSGGQRQRVAIARALVLHPTLLVLDEPTSALDRSVQKAIVTLLRDLQARHGMAYIFISHDLAVVRAMADRVMVMQNGAVVEHGPTAQIFDAPQSRYTRALLRAAFDLPGLLADRSGAAD